MSHLYFLDSVEKIAFQKTPRLISLCLYRPGAKENAYPRENHQHGWRGWMVHGGDGATSNQSFSQNTIGGYPAYNSPRPPVASKGQS